jgi:hypothetical protein
VADCDRRASVHHLDLSWSEVASMLRFALDSDLLP